MFFCDAYSPWQRGSNDNTNGLLRQYYPKKTDLRIRTAEEVQAAVDELNERPRAAPQWQTPAAVYRAASVAMIAWEHVAWGSLRPMTQDSAHTR